MKTPLCIILTCSLLVSVFCIGVSATELTDLTDTYWEFDLSPSFSVNRTFYVDFESNNSSYTALGMNSEGGVITYYYTSPTSGNVIVFDGSSWASDSFRSIHILGGSAASSGSFIGALTGCAHQISAPTYNVDVGVVQNIGFVGQVLAWLSSNSTTLVLIGLSIGLFLFVPFAITKFKQLVKGY